MRVNRHRMLEFRTRCTDPCALVPRWHASARRGLLLLMVLLAGCERPASLESPNVDASANVEEASEQSSFTMPRDYTSTVERLRECRDAIRQAVETGDLESAHYPLDEIDWLLNRLPEIARGSHVPRRSWEQVVVAGDDLGESLAEMHAEIDAGRSPKFADRADAIDEALARLEAVRQQTDEQNNNLEETER